MWYILAIIATVFISFLVIGIKYVITKGFDPSLILFISFLTSALCALIHMNIKRVNIKFDWIIISIIIFCGCISYIGNLLLTRSIKIAPNPGYTQSIVNTSAVIVAFLSYFLFKSDLSIKHIIGLIICLLGVIILSL